MIAACTRRTGAPPASGTAAICCGAIRTLSAWATVTPRPAATNACASTGSSPWPQDVLDEQRRGAPVRPDPGVPRELPRAHRAGAGEPVPGGQEYARRIREELHELDAVGCARGLEGVLEDDREVEVSGDECTQRGGAVDERVLDDDGLGGEELGVALLEERGDLGREIDERGEERPEPQAPAPQPRDVRHLRLGEGEPAEDRLGVLDEQPPGLGGHDALLRAAHELRADLALEQRDLP
jgi:hypothetical protein